MAITGHIPEAAGELLSTLSQRGIEFAIAGGIAMQAHVAGRNTQDLDLLLSPSELPAIEKFKVLEQTTDFILGSYSGLRVAILLTTNELFFRILRAFASPERFTEGEFPVVTPQGMVTLKLFALPSLYRQGESTRIAIYEGDIYALLSAYDIDDDLALSELQPFLLATDILELERILRDTRVRISRIASSFRSDASH